jgi:hypothetical protein
MAHFLRFGNLHRKFPNRKKPGFALQVLGFADANPAGFPLQCARRRSLSDRYRIVAGAIAPPESLARRQLEKQAIKLPLAILWAANCQRQLVARNQAVAILRSNIAWSATTHSALCAVRVWYWATQLIADGN